MFLTTLIALVLSTTLSDLIPPDIQQQTGLVNLTSRQQQELANYLVQFMQPNPPENQRVTLAENLHGGRVLKLSDKSIWEVAPQDVNITSLWLTPFPVTIGHSPDPYYPSTLTNQVSGTTVHVRSIQTENPADLPPAMPPQQPNPYGQPPAPSSPYGNAPAPYGQPPSGKSSPYGKAPSPTAPQNPPSAPNTPSMQNAPNGT